VSRYDVVRLFSDFNIDYDITSEEWVNVDCPFCDDEKKHGGINIRKSYYNCFKCGSHPIEFALKKILHISDEIFLSIKREYSDFLRFRGRTENEEIEKVTKIEISNLPLSEKEKSYLSDRHFDSDFLVKKYDLRSGGLIGDWKFRIIIPIIYNSKFVSLTSRTILKDFLPRYKTLANDKSIIPAKHVLFNYDNCKKDTVIITEGPFDAMRIGDDCVATLGIGMTPYQRKLLKRFRNVIFMYDPEFKAQLRAQQQAALLSELNISVSVVDLGIDHDPGDLSEKEVKYIRRELLHENS